jgi:hypothetical protein
LTFDSYSYAKDFLTPRDFTYDKGLYDMIADENMTISDYWLSLNEDENSIELIIDDQSTNLKIYNIQMQGDSSKLSLILKYGKLFYYSKPTTS